MDKYHPKSYIKSLYFLDSPPPPKAKRNSTILMALSPIKHGYPSSLLHHNETSLIKESIYTNENNGSTQKSSKNDESLKRKLKNQFLHFPVFLPMIIKDENIVKSKNTMKYFEKEPELQHEKSNKKLTLPYLFKEDGLKIIKNVQKINQNQYRTQKKQSYSKMLIKELWHKSYHKKILDLSGLGLRHERIETQKIKSYNEKVQDLNEYYEGMTKSKAYLAQIGDNETNVISEFSELERSKTEREKRDFGDFKGEIRDIMGKCKEFNEQMKEEKK